MEKINVLLKGVRIPRPRNTETPADYGLEFETHYFPGYDGFKLEAWYIPTQQVEKIVLLFHGYAKSKQELLPLASEYNKMGCACLLVDFYGSGGSGGNSTTIGINESHDVTAAFKYTRKNWPNRSPVLHGISMGGAALLRAVAMDGLSPSALIVESPFNSLPTTTRNRFNVMGLPSFPAAELLLFWGGVQQGINPFKHNPARYAKKVTCPALVLHGESDPFVSMEEAREVFNNLSGRKYFESYRGIGHTLLFKAHPQKWRKDISGFLLQK
jgi:alpha-beta hydrolase superfamily lysophospholipase